MKKKTIPLLAVILIATGCIYNIIYSTDHKTIKIVNLNEIPAIISSVKTEGMAPGKFINAFVDKIVDGDTFKVKYNGEFFTVRFLDIDAPESVKNNVPVQKYGKEAAEFTKKMALNKKVKLVFEKGLRDKYGRLLAHVLLEDNRYLNGLLVRNGFARVEVLSPNTALKDYFYSLQEDAVGNKAGLWGLPPDKQPFIKDSTGNYVPRYWLKVE